MHFAVRASRAKAVTLQIISLLKLEHEHISVNSPRYYGTKLIHLNAHAIFSISSIRNIEALLLDEETATQLQHPLVARDAVSFKSLDCVDEREQYEHLSQLLHIQKATRDTR
jgi:hypothetical protein